MIHVTHKGYRDDQRSFAIVNNLQQKYKKKKKNQPRPYTFPRIIISLTLLSQSSHSIIFFFLKKTFYTATRKLLFTSFEQIALRLPIYSFLQCSFLSECKYMGVGTLILI